MELKRLTGTDIKSILIAFNASFSDYFVPFQLTEEQLVSKMTVDNTQLHLSVGAFENGKLVAFILHGSDSIHGENVVYNGGTGVIPEKRGGGLTKKMYSHILPILKKEGINRIILEVIDSNIPAITSYTTSGFTITRELKCFKGTVQPRPINKNLEIQKLQYFNWKKMESFWDIAPTWQNSKGILNNTRSGLTLLGAFLEGKWVGYLIYNSVNHRIQQIATDKNHRRQGIASSLVTALTKTSGNSLSVINIDVNPPGTVHFFESLGFEHYLTQVEMELKITI